MNKLFISSILLLSFGCTHLQSVSTTSIPRDRSNTVEAKSSRIIFLGFNFDNDYIDEIPDELARQCPGGKVKGILTKHQTTNYFLSIVWKSEVVAKGFCEQRKSKTKTALLRGSEQ